MLYIKVQFYDPRTNSFGGKEYSYACPFDEVKPHDVVRVQVADGTSVARVSRIIENIDEIGCPLDKLKDVISFEPKRPTGEKETETVAVAEPSPEETQEIIVIRQLPIIEEHLYDLRDHIKNRVNAALSLAVTEETVKDVKKTRADLSAQFKQLEDQRKAVKSQILIPYNKFEQVYKECVTDLFGPADYELKKKIDAVENGLKDEKRTKLRNYFNEYRNSLNIDPEICDFDRMGINVLLSTSDRNLKLQAKCAVDRIAGDIATIKDMANAVEIMTEYRISLNLNQAVATVRERLARIEAEKQRRAEEEAREAERQAQLAAAAAKVEEVIENTPEPEMPPEPVFEPSPIGKYYYGQQNGPVFVEEELPFIEFRVHGTIDQLKALKKFLVDGGYQYEQL